MSDWFEEAKKLYIPGVYGYKRIAKKLGISHKTVEARFLRAKKNGEVFGDSPANDSDKNKVTYRQDGTVVSEKFVKLQEGEHLTPKETLELHGFKPELWEIVSCTNNFWNSQLTGGIKQISYQSKLTVKPIKQGITFEEIDDYFENKKFNHSKPLTTPIQYDPDGEFLEICLPDLHGGLLAWRMETGADYDVHIAKDYFFKCLYDTVDRCKNKKFKKILFVTLGDILHFDNEKQETTKGTFQQADGRMPKIYDAILDMLVDGITILGGVAPVEVVYLPGNHDRVTGRMLLKSVEMAFRKDNNVMFDMTPNPQKFKLLGNVLIGWTHGDMPEKHMATWLQQVAKKEYGACKFAEVHAGHFHSQRTKEKKAIYNQSFEEGGVVVRYLPTICNASYWEHQQAYSKSIKTMMSFVWNEETGLREMWYSNL